MAKRAKNSGTIYKLSGKRTNPWIVRVPNGYDFDDENGKAKILYKTLGYAPTKAKAQAMLEEYNSDPYNLDVEDLTFKDVYKLWSDKKFKKISHSNIKGYEASFNAFEKIHNMSFRSVDYRMLQDAIDNSDKNYPTLKKMKTLLNQMYEFAQRCDYCKVNLGKLIDVKQYSTKNPNKYEHTHFTIEEIHTLWANKDNPYVQIILMLIYNGARITTFLDLKKEDVHLEERYIYILVDKTPGSSKRVVPIANDVLPFYEEWMNRSQSEYLICTNDNKHLEYRNYRDSYWKPIFHSLGIYEHKCHDTRHTCATLLNDANVELFHTQKILGHVPNCLTQQVYIHLPLEELIKDIDKIHNVIFGEEKEKKVV